MNSGTGLNILQKEMPERYYDVGIAEQHAVLFAAGLALQGVKPVAAIYSTFLQRAFDQIVHDVCLQKLNVVFAMDRAGLVGDDGPTHHGAFDISYQRCLPNIVLMAPRDEAALVHMLHTALVYDDGPVALRYPRGEGEGVPLPEVPEAIEIGRGELLREGAGRVAFLGYGYGVQVALGAAELLESEHSLEATVADARFAKPLDTALIESLVREHEVVVTVEENVLAGGFGAAVVEHVSDCRSRRRGARPALRPARPLRHARQARAAARGGRPDARGGRGARGRGRARPQLGARSRSRARPRADRRRRAPPRGCRKMSARQTGRHGTPRCRSARDIDSMPLPLPAARNREKLSTRPSASSRQPQPSWHQSSHAVEHVVAIRHACPSKPRYAPPPSTEASRDANSTSGWK